MLLKYVVLTTALFALTSAFAIEQEAYLKASNTDPDDRLALDYFGRSLAISTNTLVVGAPGERSAAKGVNGDQGDNSAYGAGAAYVFAHDGITWSQQAYLKASNTQDVSGQAQPPGHSFGNSLGISGDTLIVGAPGDASGARVVNGDENNIDAINSGAAYVFVRNGTTWTQQAYLKASNAEGSVPFFYMGKFDGYTGDRFGQVVAISGDTVVVSAPSERSNGDPNDNSLVSSGAAYVFVRTGTNWSQQAYLKASDAHANALFGSSVSISDNTLVVGAPPARGAFNTTVIGQPMGGGAAYVFVRQGTNWTQQALLIASNSDRGDSFGRAVSIDGDTIAIGADGEDSATLCVDGDQINNDARGSGAVYVFQRVGSTWTQQAYLKASQAAGLSFGTSVSLAGSLLVAGAVKEEAYVFAPEENRWKQQAHLKASNTETGDSFGRSVGISGRTVIIGADQEDSEARGVNGDQTDNSSGGSGAAYVFTGLDFPPPSLTPIERWRQQHFGITTDSGQAADRADSDHDGLVNLLEYGLVTNPTMAQADGTDTPLPTIKTRDGDHYLHFEFTRDPVRTDVSIRVETAGDLTGPWSTVAASVQGAATSGVGLVGETDRIDCFKQVEVRDPVSSTSAPYHYLRIAVDSHIPAQD